MLRSRAEWAQIVAEYERGELSQVAFCRARGVAIATLQYWRRKLRDERRVGLVPVRVVTRPEAVAAQFEVRVGAAVLRFAIGADPAYVAALAKALADC